MSAVMSLFESLGTYALAWSWQMAVLVLFAWVAMSFDLQHRPTLRHSLWVLTLLCGLLLPWLPERIAAQSFTRQVRQVLVVLTVAAPKHEVRDVGKASFIPPAESDPLPAPEVSQGAPTVLPAWNPSSATFLRATGFLWIAGVVVAAFRRLRGYRRLGRVASIPTAGDEGSTPPILLSPGVRTPMLYGWYHPVILLPGDVAEWSTPHERATMIRHESVHYARKDHWVSAFEAFIRTVFFFHPLARWTCRQIDIERELACDVEVLRLGTEPTAYAETIIKVAEHAVVGAMPCGVYFSGTAQLDRRVDFLFRTPKQVARSTALLVPLLSLLAPTLALGFWQAPVEILNPIAFRVELNPLRVLPEEVFAPPRASIPIAKAAIPSARAQEPPLNPAVPLVPRLDLAFLKVTEDDVKVSVTVGLPHNQLIFKEETGGPMPIRRASGRVQGQVTNIAGRVLQSVDDPFEIPTLADRFNPATVSVFQENLSLAPGLYRMVLLVTDSNGGSTGTIDRILRVRGFPADQLSASSLILADVVEPLPLRAVESSFRIGSLRVRPTMFALRRDQDLNVFQQIYVPASEAGSILPLFMETLITLDGREIQRVSEALQRSAAMTITRKIPLADFTPGTYSVQTTYTDAASGERVVSTGQFSVR